MKETVTIPKRWSWLAALNVEIECDPALAPRIKLGLAVRAAYKTGANLRSADLTGAGLTGANLTGADLRGGADLTGADLRGANLTDANLREAVLRGADLRGANLTDANLRDADLTGADLRGANLTDADLRGEKIERIFALAGRLDGYTFYGVQLRTGAIKIAAGCRWYSFQQFRDHVANEYPGTDKARETLDIVEFIEKRAAGLSAPVPTAELAAMTASHASRTDKGEFPI